MALPSAQALAPLLAKDPHDFSELVEASRQFIKAWVAAGSDLTDELVLEFVSIDSQADDVLRSDDQEDFYRCFHTAFLEARDDLRRAVRGSASDES